MGEKMKLKPCPFCGSEDVEVIGKYNFFVSCNYCNSDSGVYETKRKAENAWNRRKGTDGTGN